jgi:hypothetical protein
MVSRDTSLSSLIYVLSLCIDQCALTAQKLERVGAPGNMTTLDDLPASAVRLITRFARKRRIPGTNRYARVCRSWRDAAADSNDEEQLQLLLALEDLPADAVTSTSRWLAQHGACVTSLNMTFEVPTALLAQQLLLSAAPYIGLARLEVDGPDSLVALAPALPQLVALTHLKASIGLVRMDDRSRGMFSACGVPLESPPCLQQLCPGLKSLRLDISCRDELSGDPLVEAPCAQLLPDHLEQLHIHSARYASIMVPYAALAPLTSLRILALTSMAGVHPGLLLDTPGLEEVDLSGTYCEVDGDSLPFQQWFACGRCRTPEHLAKVARLGTIYLTPEPLIGAPNLTALLGLRKLRLYIMKPGAAVYVQQLSGLSRLQHLSLLFGSAAECDVVAVLSNVPQVTCLRLYTGSAEVPRATWAAVLPHLTQLRVLAVDRQQLLEGTLLPEVHQLTQLQCLYVTHGSVDRGQSSTCCELARHLQALSECNSLRAVLCCGDVYDDDYDSSSAAQPLWELVHEGRLHLSGWHKWKDAAVEGRVMCPQRCPHLPGVWELQEVELVNG